MSTNPATPTPYPAPTTTPAAVHPTRPGGFAPPARTGYPDEALGGGGGNPLQPLTHANLHRRATANAERALWAYNEQHERARI